MKNKNEKLKLIILIVLFLGMFSSCRHVDHKQSKDIKKNVKFVRVLTTGYCHCPKCTGWKRNAFFQPVYAYGANKGKRKKVGVTSSGVKVKRGIIAADTNHFSFGTVMDIPGYGRGVVQDEGGSVKGRYHIDLYFPTHKEALKWGRQYKNVTYWKED